MSDNIPEPIKNSFLIKTLKLTAEDARAMLSDNIKSAEETLKLLIK